MNSIVKSMKAIILFVLLFAGLLSCEDEIILNTADQKPEIIVEGYILKGPDALPPYVMLSYTIPYFSMISPEELIKYGISEAQVYVKHKGKAYELQRLCINDLPENLRHQFARQLGIDERILGNIDFCVFMDVYRLIPIVEGDIYELKAVIQGETVEASTVIPEAIPVDSLYFKSVPGIDTSYREMRIFLDPPEGVHYYRYWIKMGQDGYRSSSRSVFSDKLFEEKGLDFRLLRPESAGGMKSHGDNPTRFLFHEGDSITLKWSTLDEANYNFWRTLEYNKQNQGPFSSYTRVNFSIKGGIGIWGGYNYQLYHTLVK